MTCAETLELLHAYVDGELDLVRNLELERHLAQCPDCPRAYENLRALRTALKDGAVYYAAPAALRARVRKLSHDRRHAPSWRRWTVTRGEWPWLITAAAVLAALVVLVRARGPGAPPETLAREAVASHVRSLMANHLADVISSNQHTVKPWFDGKLDFAPVVEDLASDGFPLAGGRLDYFGGQPVAALVYRRRKHFINLFTWPAAHSADTPPRAETIRGYNVIHWSEAGMAYWAVSDLGAAELRQFAGLFARRAAAPAVPRG
ncbi:MAG: anti-sigma factor family protein [Candidatus Binataceae bacterium]